MNVIANGIGGVKTELIKEEPWIFAKAEPTHEGGERHGCPKEVQ